MGEIGNDSDEEYSKKSDILISSKKVQAKTISLKVSYLLNK